MTDAEKRNVRLVSGAMLLLGLVFIGLVDLRIVLGVILVMWSHNIEKHL